MPTPPVRTSPPDHLVTEGEFVFGTFDAPVPDVNLLDRWSGPARLLHASRLKEWQAFQLGNAEWFVLGAVYDAKLLGLLQIVAIHKETANVSRWEHKVPSTKLHIARGLDHTQSRGATRGLSISITNNVPVGSLRVTALQRAVQGSDTPTTMTLDVEGHCGTEEAGHLVICHPFPDGTPLYSDKCVMAASGTLRVGEPGLGDVEAGDAEVIRFERADSFLILDDHKGHYPSPMRYDWVTGAHHDPDGRRIAFNLTDNQVRDPERFNENGLFVDAEVHRLPPVSFERPKGVHDAWRVTDRDGRVDVTFEPTVRNEQHVGPRSFLADYYGPFGWFTGTIEPEGADAVRVDGSFGMGEQKFIRF